MALTKAAEEAFHKAIEAAYVVQEPGISAEDKRLAEKAYKHWLDEYYCLSSEHHGEQWWAAECKADPSAARCRIYDL